jgi:arylsulfatase A-like enzyme
MSDNGGGGKMNRRSDRVLAGGKGSLFEGGIRVPLIVRGPGVKPGSFCRVSVTGCDLLPTFCELAGVTKLPEDVDGTSLVPLLTGRTEAFKRQRDELLFHYPHYGRGPTQKPVSALLAGSLKLILWHETGATKLFDLSRDLAERNDLSARMPEKASELKSRLEKYLKDVGAQMTRPNPNYTGPLTGEGAEPERPGLMQRADRNGDGKVSRDEFRGPPERFNRLDRNRDGFITKDEERRMPRR